MNRPPCPEWCVTDHDRMEADELWDDLREHFSADSRVPTLAYDGGDHLTDTVSVSLTRCDDPETGEVGKVGLWFEAGGEVLSPARAVEYAVAILNAARLASGVRLDILAGDGDRGATDRRYAAKAVLHSMAVSWPAGTGGRDDDGHLPPGAAA